MKIAVVRIHWRPWMILGWCAIVSGCATTPVFRGGQVLLPVIVATDASPEEHDGARELARVLEKMSGIAWPVRPAVRPGEKGFYIGAGRTVARAAPALKLAPDLVAPKAGEVGPDAFRIRTRNGGVTIEGATPEATCYAIAWLLQRYAGVRWYAPGANGEIVPRRAEWSLPRLQVTIEPAYVSREITGLESTEEVAWAQHNGLRGRLEFSHALSRIFPPTLIARHPDWAPLLQGKRFDPRSPAERAWQPNLALPEVAEHAAQVAAAFARKPARPSFSLGINDNVRFDESAATRALVEPLRYFRGKPDYSPLVFTFMNRAADSFARTNPDNYLGCLAYFWCENPPPFPLRPNVLPFVTKDRSQYFDANYRAEDLVLMSRWGASGARAFGLWEYAYGQNFLVPRQTLAALAESVREGWQRGARGYFAEVGPHWGFDAFKVWMLAQLLWEPDRSCEELAQDFFRGYFGPAAKPMRRFFERCEARWMAQSGPPFWLKYYLQEDQALMFPPELCRELRGLLGEAAHVSEGDPAVAERVDRAARAFAVTEAFVEFDLLRRILASANAETELPTTIASWLNAERELQRRWNEARSGEQPAMAAMELAPFLRNDPVGGLLWRAGQADARAPRRLLEAAGTDALQREPWRVLADSFSGGKLSQARDLTANGRFAKIAQEGQEPRFLFPLFGALPADWELRAMPTEGGKVGLVRAGEDTNARRLRIESAWDTQLYQWLPISARGGYVATARLRGHSSAGNDSALFLTFLSADGNVAGSYRMQSLPKGLTEEWRTLALADLAPVGAAWVGVGIGVSRQVAGDWVEVDSVELRAVTGSDLP